MIALIDNMTKGTIRIMLYQDDDSIIAQNTEHEMNLAAMKNRSVFILKAESLAAMLKTHGNWFDKLDGK